MNDLEIHKLKKIKKIYDKKNIRDKSLIKLLSKIIIGLIIFSAIILYLGADKIETIVQKVIKI
ncbi:hypothetical protein SAMN02745163_02353 [Clostridium cavendishii DSM 21758]|uniref:Uncharacterized protein n=1 Tax=Clostridium cavendishii DSM 21758 TaxID=1121302 RepID=A0A1M6L0G3_9CLOT|nr:hypothetical protein [Clostridium cavendishii]SHJ64755.1 hypothetical protein SAMN02745163_02353 [Clostridium cavendishii DSM 21758]